MEFFRRYSRTLGRYLYIVFAVFLLTGCAGREQQAVSVSGEVKDTSNKAEESMDTTVDVPQFLNLICWEQVKEAETEDYYIRMAQAENKDGKMVEYPQIIAKEGKEIFCGANKINERLEGLSYWQDYNILYADRYYISLWCDDKGGKGRTYFFDLQCQELYEDDNDYRDAPWPSGEIPLSLDVILEEIEKGNYDTDEAGCHWCDVGKNNMNVIVQIDGKNIVLQDGDVQEMASENEKLKKTIADYEMQISDLEDESKNLMEKLGVVSGELDDAPAIEFQDLGLSINGEEKVINKDRASVFVNGVQYYSQARFMFEI